MFVAPLLLAVLRDAEGQVLIVGHRDDGIQSFQDGAVVTLHMAPDGLTITFPDGREALLPDTSHHDLLTSKAVFVGVLEGAELIWQSRVILDLSRISGEVSTPCLCSAHSSSVPQK